MAPKPTPLDVQGQASGTGLRTGRHKPSRHLSITNRRWARRDGKPFEMQTFFGQAGNLFASPFEFRQHGESGRWVSNLLPNLAGCVDKLTLIHSMTAKSANHMPAVAQMNTGFVLNGFPSMGTWVSYGLGTENQDLPAYVVLPDPRSLPWGGTLNWSSAFLPATYQGTAFRTSGEAVPDLDDARDHLSRGTRKPALGWLDTHEPTVSGASTRATPHSKHGCDPTSSPPVCS